MAFFGALPATKESFMEAFRTAGCCSVLPGGIAEMFMVEEDRDRIYFKKRFGYIKVALESGVDIVPVFHFGNAQILRVIGKSGILAYMSRKLKMSIMLPYGRWGLPIPFRQPILSVVGAPIKVKKTLNPSRELVREYQKKIEESFREMYIKHRHKNGWADRELSIE
eukprot:CAMPEP_0167763934 /NCGR_PEP_ID=MMETSP0110_2-20121227/13697_1 /TAXON_ID=629695 /ORGANISM="Gymnochlora sp., Strain CCMP2014" /LENGTH=165 /DNA_ID=CAMNT_0007651171 /DNA_START=440 /DNA_END=937 /DNA_ORIENTATION=-